METEFQKGRIEKVGLYGQWPRSPTFARRHTYLLPGGKPILTSPEKTECQNREGGIMRRTLSAPGLRRIEEESPAHVGNRP